MQEGILGQVIRKHIIARELAEEIPDLGLMTTHQLAECIGILLRHHLSNQFIVSNAWCSRFFADTYDSFFFP